MASKGEIKWTIERAKTGRSKCKGSKELIPQDDVRVGKITKSPFDEEKDMISWYAVDPFFEMMGRMRKTSKKIEDTSELPGFDDLDEEAQTSFAQKLAHFWERQLTVTKTKGKKRPKPESLDDNEATEEKPKQKSKKTAKKNPLPTYPSEVEAWTTPREMVASVIIRAKAARIKVPEDDGKARMEVGAILMSKKDGDSVDIGVVLTELHKKYKGKDDKKMEVACEANRGLVEAFIEIADYEFKMKDTTRGISARKTAAAIANATTAITDGKSAMKLENVGKTSGGRIDEFLETGTMEKLERIRES